MSEQIYTNKVSIVHFHVFMSFYSIYAILSRICFCRDLRFFCVNFWGQKLRLRKFFDKYDVCQPHQVPATSTSLSTTLFLLISCKKYFHSTPSSIFSFQALLSAPNPDDPLANDVAELWKANEAEALKNARDCTRKYAMGN